ncbi:hypothetical protein IV203_018792 [Nitzschia inconspicua]|uniref:Uncharacterized protein n=1 Tax=Nitzschia inconspicua TaxID=303405 RepID=A0A9K3M211_9STRA|nr:hypothetical protein IV203_018792 [Nitzschia inconspicua]
MNHTNADDLHGPSVLISGVDTDSDDEFEDASALDGLRPMVSNLQAVLEAATITDLQAALEAASLTAPSAPSDLLAPTPATIVTTAEFDVGAPLRVRSVPITAPPKSGYVQITSAARLQQTGTELLKTNAYIVADSAPQLFSLMDLHTPNLDSLVDLHANLEVVSRHFLQYDLYEVFRLVKPLPAPPPAFFTDMSATPSTVSAHLASDRPDLFAQYGALQITDVLASNAWFRTWSADPWICPNLDLSATYLYARMAPDLRTILRAKHDSFPSAQQGGPLLLYLLIHQVVAANESVGRVLVDRLNTVTISSYPGEDITKVVAHLRALVRSLKAIRRRDASGLEISFVPSDLTKRIYKILATASCPTFTLYFANRFTEERNAELFDVARTYVWTEADLLLSAAERLYQDLLTNGDWLGTKQNHATFPVFTSPTDAAAFLTRLHCHNCDGPHLLRSCPLPRDEARISANRKRMDKTRKLARKNTPASAPASTTASPAAPASAPATPAHRTKWPPRPKRGESTDAIIDGRPHFFHFKKGRWVPSTRSASASVAPPTVTAAPVPSVNIAAPSAPVSVITSAPTVAPSAPTVAVAAVAPEPDDSTLAARRLHAQMLIAKFQEDFQKLGF